MPDRPIDEVAMLLREHGISAAVTQAGHAGDVVAIAAPVDCIADLRRLSQQIRDLGFRYVTLEITTSEEP